MLHKVREYMQMVAGDKTKEEEIYEILNAGMMKLKAHDEQDFVHMMLMVHCVAYGPHFDEYMAKKAVDAMHNVDGTVGGHWTMEETNKYADQHGYKIKADWFYVMNMLYSDYACVLGNNADTYAKMAKAYLTDPDAEEGKAFKLYVAGH